jgi:tetratricopeptide (TPR) repeat protein
MRSGAALPRTFEALFFCLLAAAVIGAYAGSLPAGFYFDDTYGITQNPSVRTLANIPRYFLDPFLLTTYRNNVDVRPILQVTFALNYAISQYAPWSWRVFNIAVHLVTSWLVFVCVRDHCWWPREERGGSSRWPAAATALIFALAPVNHQAVVYLWARSALLCTCFYVGAFLAFLERRFKLAAALFLLALLTKTIAVTLPLVLLVYDFVEEDGWKDAGAWLRGVPARMGRPWARLWGVLALFLIYRASLLPGWADQTRHESFVSPLVWLMSEWTAYLYYVRLFLWPDALSVDHEFAYNLSLSAPRTLISLVCVTGWLWLALREGRKQPAFAFATAWYFLTLAPESTLVPLSEVVNDHRPYLGSALGLSLLLSWSLTTLLRRLPLKRPEPALAAVTAALGLAALPVLVHRNWQWQDGLRLWLDAAAKGPGNGRALTNAGCELMGRGRLAEARSFFERARAIWPRYAFLHLNLSVLESAEGRFPEALREADEAMQLAPDFALAHFHRGAALERLGRRPEAELSYRRALELEPQLELARAALEGKQSTGPVEGMMQRGLDALYAGKDPGAAVTAFQEVLARMPSHYGATYQLAVALDLLGRPAEARVLWERMLRMADAQQDAQTAQTARARLAGRR